MADELLADVGVLPALRGELSGLGTRMRANDPSTALAPVAAATVSSEVAAACVAAGPDLLRALSVLAGRVDITSVAVGEAVTYTGFGAHDFTSASGGEGPWYLAGWNFDAHSSYWEPGNPSLIGMGKIVAGYGAGVQ